MLSSSAPGSLSFTPTLGCVHTYWCAIITPAGMLLEHTDETCARFHRRQLENIQMHEQQTIKNVLSISPRSLLPSFIQTAMCCSVLTKHSLWAVSLVPHKCNLLPFYRHNWDYIKDGISTPPFLSMDTQRGFFISEIQLLPFRLRHGLYPCCLIKRSDCFRGLSTRKKKTKKHG